MGRLVPAGTGLSAYRKLEIAVEDSPDDMGVDNDADELMAAVSED